MGRRVTISDKTQLISYTFLKYSEKNAVSYYRRRSYITGIKRNS